jgi:hypothetical protein
MQLPVWYKSKERFHQIDDDDECGDCHFSITGLCDKIYPALILIKPALVHQATHLKKTTGPICFLNIKLNLKVKGRQA